MVQTSSKIPTLNLYPYNRVVVVLAKLPRTCAADHAQAGSVIVNPVGNLDELCAVICRENDLCGRIDPQRGLALGHRNVAAEGIQRPPCTCQRYLPPSDHPSRIRLPTDRTDNQKGKPIRR